MTILRSNVLIFQNTNKRARFAQYDDKPTLAKKKKTYYKY